MAIENSENNNGSKFTDNSGGEAKHKREEREKALRSHPTPMCKLKLKIHFSAAVPATSLTVPASGVTESFGFSHSDKKLHSSAVIFYKPNDDGYNWRKYGQKSLQLAFL
ncbi:uncharacterized protein HKW66_Vig0148820 [Vigna angularis]|uniref:WRKY domain-containing protein n=1 Tax=Phaseolus angularis TaxID=3914 RepID=A0A8T0JUZ8_PHAAN|nr:uncharacterized protein HKW66_Vig0148820 [Vigna angularis]